MHFDEQENNKVDDNIDNSMTKWSEKAISKQIKKKTIPGAKQKRGDEA